MIGVVAEVASYRVAVAELPLSTRLADDRAGAIVVVEGTARWCDGVRAAAEAGAAAVVVSRPVAVGAELVQALVADLGSLPVLIERPFLRHDTVADLRSVRDADAARPAVVAVDAVAAASTFDVVLRDAIGWLRVLSGGRPTLKAAGDGTALIETADGGSGPAVLTAVRVLAGSDRVNALSLGEVRAEIDASEAGGVVSTTTPIGRTTLPRRHESHERLTLRRALDALAGGSATTDLAELAEDAHLAALVSRGIPRL
ncbi:hypothetical protein ACPW96_12600 [Micromonospora sp. DT81.3]|uniref:hypothetical protein n=1 Tax=Micromonospora sp. DT81.3 TaxID=3416523 RepID=UPI003CEC8227